MRRPANTKKFLSQGKVAAAGKRPQRPQPEPPPKKKAEGQGRRSRPRRRWIHGEGQRVPSLSARGE